MKVGELEIGMMIEPAGDQENFMLCRQDVDMPADRMPYIVVRTRYAMSLRQTTTMASLPDRKAMYLGTRKDVNVARHDFGWANRFVLFNGVVAAVDPPAWARIKVVS